MCLYTDDLLEKTANNNQWGIYGAGILASDVKMKYALEPQDNLFTVVTKGSDNSISARVVGSMVDYIWAAEGRKQ
jgi:mannitol 2-dehydrogenase